jgi:hypothetical protein
VVERALSRVRERIADGADLEQLEELIAATREITDDERSALWLYAWHCLHEASPAVAAAVPPESRAREPTLPLG